MKREEQRRESQHGDYWDLIIALRLFLIIMFILAPVIFVSAIISYIQPMNIILIGFIVLLILRFVLFEPRNYSRRYQIISLVFLIPLTCLVFLNFILGLIRNLIYSNFIAIILPLIVCVGGILFFYFTVPKNRFKVLNGKLISWKNNWSSRGKGQRLKRHFIVSGTISWVIISSFLVFIPYPVYIQAPPEDIDNQKIGLWTGYTSNIKNETMELMAENNIYLVTTVRKEYLNSNLTNFLYRCRNYSIEVHMSMLAPSEGIYGFVNIWTIEKNMEEIEDILDWLDIRGFIGDPFTTIIYDMEGLVQLSFTDYLVNNEIKSKLEEYHELQQKFVKFNDRIREKYDLDFQICGMLAQGMDYKDGDDDMNSFYGLLADEKASNSYMIYRKDFYDLNYVLDTCRMLEKGDTIILNSWKFEGCECWKDIDCLIEECRLVLGYPGKEYNLLFWRYDNFLLSYGVDGLHKLIKALTEDPSEWHVIYVWYTFPKSDYFDLFFLLFGFLELYSPLIKFLFQMYYI